MTGKLKLYLPLFAELKLTTNLTQIQKKLGISKQNLNNYLRQLKKDGFIIQKGRGWYEVVKEVNFSTKYGSKLSKDSIRGHAFVFNVQLPKEIKGWKERITVLKSKGVHFNLVGALKTTPRMKVLGRKVWLCNNHLRVFFKPKESYYGQTAIESRKYAFQELLLVVGALESKLGVSLRPFDFSWRKEHYALIKNDLAIDQNRKGIIWRIKDEQGEWLLVDDSLEQGGELENVGEKSFITNIPMQKWWNQQKETKFEVTPKFILDSINQVTQNQLMFAKNIEEHMEVLKGIKEAINELRKDYK